MRYHVYENWRVKPDKAIVHRGDCGHCKNGSGQSGKGTKRENGKWHPGQDSRSAAFRLAKSLNRTRIEGCGHCKP